LVRFWIVPFAWGLSEAMFFFFVPDVWLTWLVFTTQERTKLRIALLCALTGAIIGGLLMYEFGSHASYEQAASWLAHIPGIHRNLVDQVGEQVRQGGAGSVFTGILKGVPYKIYATQWGVNKGSIWLWVGVSILARGGRFLFSMLIARLISRTRARFFIFFVFWISFYILYFNHYSH
jgi:membrane protein YqaA with SNARE-associated domain